MSEKFDNERLKEFSKEIEISNIVSRLESLPNSDEYEYFVTENAKAKAYYAEIKSLEVEEYSQTPDLLNENLLPKRFRLKDGQLYYAQFDTAESGILDISFNVASRKYQFSTKVEQSNQAKLLKVVKTQRVKNKLIKNTTVCDANIGSDLILSLQNATYGSVVADEKDGKDFTEAMDDLILLYTGESIFSTNTFHCENGWSLIATLTRKSKQDLISNEVTLDIARQCPDKKLLVYTYKTTAEDSKDLRSFFVTRRFIDGTIDSIESSLALQFDDAPHYLDPRDDDKAWTNFMYLAEETVCLAMRN